MKNKCKIFNWLFALLSMITIVDILRNAAILGICIFQDRLQFVDAGFLGVPQERLALCGWWLLGFGIAIVLVFFGDMIYCKKIREKEATGKS